ncbi:winged helix-turn-helix domain-containing protein [Streptomyces monticola]|uniref:Winged helix-turn-helix domain-containing protein n=1 Tax=Streptomyces monticola TaxID=2666263 RepID=A0ABW2JEK3_9ACTN
MTTALPVSAPAAPSVPRHLHPVSEGARGFVGYLVLLPEGTDPTELFARHGIRPQLQALPAADAPYTGTPPSSPSPSPFSPRGGVRIDSERHVAELDGRELDLTYLEFELLAQLVGHPQRVHSREYLVSRVWGYGHVGDGRTVDVHIARLRRKLGEAHRRSIVTVRRVGYKYVPVED